MGTYDFEIDPVPASRPRVTRYGTYYAERYEQFRNDMAKLLLRHKEPPYEGSILIYATFCIPIPKSYSQKARKAMEGTYCTGNMDLDNLEKALYDSLNGIVFKDDRQIVAHSTKKIWSQKGRILVNVLEPNESPRKD